MATDLKAMKLALEQLEEERRVSREQILGAIEDALAAAYKKDLGKKDQIIRAKFDLASGRAEFFQVKTAVAEAEPAKAEGMLEEPFYFNPDQHIRLADAQKINKSVKPGEELIFPLEDRGDYGRIAAQTAKQVIIQRVREAERGSILAEYTGREGQILSGKVQKMERGNVFVDLGRTTGVLPREEQIPGEYYRQGERVRAYLYSVEETPRGINLRLSRAHPKFVEKLFEAEAPEIAKGLVEIRAIAREPGGRTKLAVLSHDRNIDPVGSCVGQRGARVNTVIAELGGEKIDIIEWSDDPETLIPNALSPAKIQLVKLRPEEQAATIEVEPDQFSLAIGRGGQNVRLAAKLTGWKIDIAQPEGEREEGAGKEI